MHGFYKVAGGSVKRSRGWTGSCRGKRQKIPGMDRELSGEAPKDPGDGQGVVGEEKLPGKLSGN